jgi:hypothetical protein
MDRAGVVVRNYCNAWLADDVGALFDPYHDDVVLEWPPTSGSADAPAQLSVAR